jgi:hypothetical protein
VIVERMIAGEETAAEQAAVDEVEEINQVERAAVGEVEGKNHGKRVVIDEVKERFAVGIVDSYRTLPCLRYCGPRIQFLILQTRTRRRCHHHEMLF